MKINQVLLLIHSEILTSFYTFLHKTCQMFPTKPGLNVPQTNTYSPLVGRRVNIVQIDIVPADFHSCYIILPHSSGRLLRFSATEAE